MHLTTAVTLTLGAASAVLAITGRTYTGWDCCKPGCAWPQNLNSGIRGQPRVCDINNRPLANGLNAQSGCYSTGGPAYFCDTYAPIPVSDDLSYGFAVIPDLTKCCKCYEMKWTSGAAKGKRMIVQIVNAAFPTTDLKATDIVIQTPGGGSGPNPMGCRAQYGTNWGAANGGVDNAAACASLPNNLQGGCYWRFNWARGAISGWTVDYQPVTCPSRLTDISGCSA